MIWEQFLPLKSFLELFKKFISNWGQIALQCCVGFCCPTTQISHNYTPVTSLYWTLIEKLSVSVTDFQMCTEN